MDKLIIKILILLCLPTLIFSQTNYSKDEIYKSWTKMTNRTKTQYNYKFQFDTIVVDFIDSLKTAGIDTIGVYGEQYVGYDNSDACQCGLIPWITFVHWIEKGKTYHRMIMKCCSFKTKEIDYSVLINYYLNSKNQLDLERIMPNIKSISRDKNGEYILEFVMIDHTTHYLIYCNINGHSIFTTFEEDDFRNEKSIFYNDNNSSILKSWKDLILNQIYELD